MIGMESEPEKKAKSLFLAPPFVCSPPATQLLYPSLSTLLSNIGSQHKTWLFSLFLSADCMVHALWLLYTPSPPATRLVVYYCKSINTTPFSFPISYPMTLTPQTLILLSSTVRESFWQTDVITNFSHTTNYDFYKCEAKPLSINKSRDWTYYTNAYEFRVLRQCRDHSCERLLES